MFLMIIILQVMTLMMFEHLTHIYPIFIYFYMSTMWRYDDVDKEGVDVGDDISIMVLKMFMTLIILMYPDDGQP